MVLVVAEIIEDGRWLTERLEFLEAELDRTTDAGTRSAIEDEIGLVRAALEGKRDWSGWLAIGARLPHKR
jgi:hypothetical protein